MILELDLEPGKGAGPFHVGMTIREVIGLLQGPLVSLVPTVELKYDSSGGGAGSTILLDLTHNGVLLRFDSDQQQRLASIEIYKVHRVRLKYGGTVFSCPEPSSASASPLVVYVAQDAGPQQVESLSLSSLDIPSAAGGPPQEYDSLAPTFVNIYRRFGPSYPGDWKTPDYSEYTLRYPGLAFTFRVPQEHRATYKSQAERGQNEHPIEFPDGRSAVTCRIVVHSVEPQQPQQQPSPDVVEVTLGSGIAFPGRGGGASIRFGSSVQDVVSELGAPQGVFFKDEDKMRIFGGPAATAQLPQQQQEGQSARGDYFYNYFDQGLDVLFDKETGTARKFILHTNFPHHRDFNMYSRCSFRLVVPINPGSTQQQQQEQLVINADTPWEQISRAFGGAGKPIVNDGGSADNPFGPTFFYGFRNVIFEVLQNGRLSSICLFRS